MINSLEFPFKGNPEEDLCGLQVEKKYLHLKLEKVKKKQAARRVKLRPTTKSLTTASMMTSSVIIFSFNLESFVHVWNSKDYKLIKKLCHKLKGDDEDRERLEKMTEREREEELFKRAENRENLKKRFEIKKKLKQQQKHKEEKKQVSP